MRSTYAHVRHHQTSGKEQIEIEDIQDLGRFKDSSILLVEERLVHGHGMNTVKQHLQELVNIHTRAMVANPGIKESFGYVGLLTCDDIHFRARIVFPKPVSKPRIRSTSSIS